MSSSILPPRIETASLVWRDGVPESSRFGDIYFSRDDGLEETRYVFLKHNKLPERFCEVAEAGSFVIAETGFGTGLNFLAAWQAWREHGPCHTATLHFVSVERYPLTREDLEKALALWPELAPLAEQLIAAYPPQVQGVHRLLLDGGKVRLTLYFGDVLDAWQALDFQADAWFLDGFAPSLNPDMWMDQAIKQIRSHSKPGTTLATFTSVGRIRRALADAGFDMQKTRGFGRKRDMLIGNLPQGKAATGTTPGTVAIVGAGIAGCLLARNLADRGIPVTLIDSANDAGSAASGNRQGAMYVKLAVDFNDQAELALTALTFSQRYYAPFRDSYWHPTGLLQLAYSPQEQDRQRRFLERNDYPSELLCAVDAARASELTGIPIPASGLWFPGCGWLEPGNLCRALCDHPLITRIFGFTVTGLSRQKGQWQLQEAQGRNLNAERIVICAGHRSPELIPVGDGYRLKTIRGQVTHLTETALHSPSAVVCGSRYLNPASAGEAVTGATFDLRSSNPELTPESQQENLVELEQMLPGVLSPDLDTVQSGTELRGRVGFRCTTHDYQPVAGQLRDPQGEEVAGAYLFTGLGSKGMTYAPLLAEYLGDLLSGQPVSLPSRLRKRIETGRIHQP